MNVPGFCVQVKQVAMTSLRLLRRVVGQSGRDKLTLSPPSQLTVTNAASMQTATTMER